MGDVKKRPKGRYFYIDVWRGIAIVMMIVFHFFFDLNNFHYVKIDFNHEPFWINFRLVIVSLFLGLVGISLQLATSRGFNRQRYLLRLGKLVGAAALVSIGAYLVFPKAPIYFGVLHFIALASVLGLLFRRFFWINLVLGVGIIVFGIQFYAGVFESPFWYWSGLMAGRPYTGDYVPFFPWFGVVLIGMFMARVMDKYSVLSRSSHGGSGFVKTLAWSGRRSLLIYLLHQPLLFAGFYLVAFVSQL